MQEASPSRYREREMTDTQTAFVAVGANIEPETNIEAALEALMQQLDVQETSTFYRTSPVERKEQPRFVNGVWKVGSTLAPRQLKYEVLRKIEVQLGRVRTDDTHAARPIDLDVVLFGDSVISEPGLAIPDPDIRTRPFIAVPLLELRASRSTVRALPRWPTAM